MGDVSACFTHLTSNFDVTLRRVTVDLRTMTWRTQRQCCRKPSLLDRGAGALNKRVRFRRRSATNPPSRHAIMKREAFTRREQRSMVQRTHVPLETRIRVEILCCKPLVPWSRAGTIRPAEVPGSAERGTQPSILGQERAKLCFNDSTIEIISRVILVLTAMDVLPRGRSYVVLQRPPYPR